VLGRAFEPFSLVQQPNHLAPSLVCNRDFQLQPVGVGVCESVRTVLRLRCDFL